jgi:acetyl-CoA C-acetyltransferase
MSGKKTLAKISVKNHHNGSMNPKAHFQREVTVEQVMNAPIMAWPLGLLDCCPVADGAAAAVLCRADMAKKFRDDYLLVKAIEITAGPGNFCSRDDYDYVHWEETVTAAQRAYEKVGVKEPFKELSMVELHDCFTITELITYEDLLLCPRGESSRFVESGVFTLEGECPVNPDGGLKSFGHPLGASGLRMVYEMWLQFHHKAGGRQIKKPFELGLAHNLGGTLDGYIIAVGIIGAP